MPALPLRHMSERLTNPLLHLMLRRMNLNLLKLPLQRHIRANVHLWSMPV